jgi:hypothetical protein
MKMIGNLTCSALAAFVLAAAPGAHAATIPVTDWAVHNQLGSETPTIADAATNSPTFDVGGNKDNAVVMGAFPGVSLANDGDYIKLSATLTMTGRTNNTGAVGLNTMLRLGLYGGPSGAVALEDVPDLGVFSVYANTNQAANRYLRAQGSSTQVNPFLQTADIVQGTDTGNQIQGANPGPVDFELTLTRNAGLLDLIGKISGVDSSDGSPYVANYATTGYDASAVGLSFNRAGFFFGSQVNAPSALLANVTVETNVPEPCTCLLAVAAAMGIAGASRRGRRRR